MFGLILQGRMKQRYCVRAGIAAARITRLVSRGKPAVDSEYYLGKRIADSVAHVNQTA